MSHGCRRNYSIKVAFCGWTRALCKITQSREALSVAASIVVVNAI